MHGIYTAAPMQTSRDPKRAAFLFLAFGAAARLYSLSDGGNEAALMEVSMNKRTAAFVLEHIGPDRAARLRERVAFYRLGAKRPSWEPYDDALEAAGLLGPDGPTYDGLAVADAMDAREKAREESESAGDEVLW